MKRYIVMDEDCQWEAHGWVAKELIAFWLGTKSWLRFRPQKIYILHLGK